MKLLVFSDSHGCLSGMREAISLEQPDQILHLGDYVRDASAIRQEISVPLHTVPGNCDGFTGQQEQRVLEVAGKRLFLCHGHQFQVKLSCYRATLAAREAEADVLLYGHTHRQHCEQDGDLWILNPGSCGYGEKLNYGVIKVENGQLLCYNVSR